MPTKKKPTTKKSPANKKSPPKKKRSPRKKTKPVAPENKPLTGKQAQFVMWYCSAAVNCNGVEAARRANYAGDYNTLAVTAHDNLKKPNIAKAINQRIADASKDAGITVESVLRDLKQVYLLAIEHKQMSAAKGSVELQGKYLKMWTDKIERVDTIDDVSTDRLWALVKEIAEGNNIDLVKLLAGDGADDGAVPAPTEN